MSGPAEDRRRRLAGRARIIRRVRQFFEARGFLEVDTPVVVPSPGLDLHLDAFPVDAGPGARPMWLSTSPEYQMKRLLGEGFEAIFQITRAFRRGEVGERHNPEFSMLEFYRAEADVEDVMADTEALVGDVLRAEVGDRLPGPEGTSIDLVARFDRITVREAFAKHAGVDEDAMLKLARADEARFFELWAFSVEPALARAPRPLFVYDYPATQASLARLCKDHRYAERFELYVGGIELCNGFGELTDASEQRKRLHADQRARAERGLPVYPVDERFLGALQRGIPRCAGNAVGVDRLVALALGAPSVAGVMTFPWEAL